MQEAPAQEGALSGKSGFQRIRLLCDRFQGAVRCQLGFGILGLFFQVRWRLERYKDLQGHVDFFFRFQDFAVEKSIFKKFVFELVQVLLIDQPCSAKLHDRPDRSRPGWGHFQPDGH